MKQKAQVTETPPQRAATSQSVGGRDVSVRGTIAIQPSNFVFRMFGGAWIFLGLSLLLCLSAQAQTQTTSFQAPAVFPGDLGTIPMGVATGDFNGDGLLDFVVAEYNPGNPATGQLVFYLGNSNGTFTEQVAIPISGTIAGQPYGTNHIISVGHFNGPSQPLGVAVALTTSPTCGTGGPGVYILYSMPTSASGSISVCQATSAAPTSVAVADFNGDTFDDFAVSNPSGSALGTMSVYFNLANASSGQSGFGLLGNFSATPINTSPSTLYGTLVTGNLGYSGGVGLALLASTGPFSQYVDVLVPAQAEVNGGPLFWTFVQSPAAVAAPPNGFSDIAAVPANGSNPPSVLGIGSQGLNSISVTDTAATSLTPTLGALTTVGSGGAAFGFALATADLDGNGIPDIVSLNETHHSLAIELNPTGTVSNVGPFGPAGQSLAVGFSTNLNRWVIVDAGVYQANAPGSLTVIPEDRSVAAFLVDPTTGQPSTALVFAQSSQYTNSAGVPAFAVADLNGDGSPDVAVLGEDQATFGATITPFQNVFATNSAGFVAQPVTDLGSGGSVSGLAPNGYAVVAGHFRSAANNPSGLPDLALFSSQGPTLLENLGSFQFSLDSNCVGTTTTSSCYLGGDSHFPALPATALTAVPAMLAVDVNGDGIDDIVMAYPENCAAFDPAGVRSAIYVFISNGDGTFKPPVYYASPVVNPVALAAGKVLNSGYLDLVVANGGEICSTALAAPSPNVALALLPNNHDGTGSFGLATALISQLTPVAYPNISSVAIADMNLDGVPDIVASANDGLHVLLSPSTTVASFTDLGAVPLYGAPDSTIQNASQLTIADFNRDGAPDVGAVINGIAYIFPNNGIGGLSAPAEGYASGPDSTQAVGIDVNGDGAPDLLIANSLGFSALVSTTPAGVTIGSAAHLVISANPVAAGTSSTVAVTVANSGPANATNVLVTYNVPAGLQFVAAGSSSQCSAATATQVVCTIGALTAGTTSSILQIAVASTVAQSASYPSTFTASSSQPEGVPASDATITISVQVNGAPAPQLLSVSPSQGTPGQQALQLTLVGTNFESAGAGVTFSNPGITIVAGSLTVQSSTTAVVTINISSTAATGASNVTLSTAAGQSTAIGAFAVVAAPPPPAVINVSESITVSDAPSFSDIADSEPIHVSDQVFITPLINVAGPVAYFSAQSLGFGGSSGTQVVTLSNIGDAAMTLESVSAPSNAAFVISAFSCSDGGMSFPNTLPPGGLCSFTISYTAPSGTAASGNIVFTDTSGLSNLTSTPSASYFTQTLPMSGSGSTTAGGAPPPATVTISVPETIHVADAPTFADVFDPETIHVVDTVSVTVVVLQSITVTPANPTIVVGASQAFTATGRSSDGSTRDLTSSVSWTSSNTSAATMSGATATGVAAGTATITATLGSIAGSTALAVQAPFLRIAAQYKSIALQTNGTYLVTISVTNTGNIAASKVTVLVAALEKGINLRLMTSSTPALNLAPGATGTVTIVFPSRIGRPGTTGVTLVALGDATGANPNGAAAIPALWTAAKTGITLP